MIAINHIKTSFKAFLPSTPKNLAAKQAVHDMRSPIMLLKTLTRVSKNLNEKEKRLLEGSYQRIESITDDLLQQNGYKGPAPRGLNQVIYDLFNEKHMEYQQFKHLQLIYQINPEIEHLFLPYDEFKLMRVLSNIVNNAVDAVNGIGTVRIKSLIKNKYLILSVIDNGCGIPKESLPYVTKYGFTNGKENGSGLGLGYANDIVKKWGGRFVVKSEVKVGTKVTIYLPMK